ncbi:hypothetical protein OOT46_28600 [Aquabacterium sp. A7-Y]|uniref:hypothetical protein n=1 Tax=Aquabacterium sp. A7-Y TaxID=1349605 RepID=UPI00223D4F98|nr:hypothetical protein [Aquabacterium sp. A7-Y]MCW7541762.1 hypothetical protein [Aquabacterium sp. A7-Y]
MSIEHSIADQLALVPQVDTMRATDAEGNVVYGAVTAARISASVTRSLLRNR